MNLSIQELSVGVLPNLYLDICSIVVNAKYPSVYAGAVYQRMLSLGTNALLEYSNQYRQMNNTSHIDGACDRPKHISIIHLAIIIQF